MERWKHFERNTGTDGRETGFTIVYMYNVDGITILLNADILARFAMGSCSNASESDYLSEPGYPSSVNSTPMKLCAISADRKSL